MLNKTTKFAKQILIIITAISVITTASTAPVLAQADGGDGSGDSSDNFICTSPGLSGALESLLTVIVVAAGLVAVAGGTLFTMASAARPGNADEYAESRNKALLYGLGSLVILYAGNAIVSQISESLSYNCILPFVEDGGGGGNGNGGNGNGGDGSGGGS